MHVRVALCHVLSVLTRSHSLSSPFSLFSPYYSRVVVRGCASVMLHLAQGSPPKGPDGEDVREPLDRQRLLRRQVAHGAASGRLVRTGNEEKERKWTH